MCWRAQVCALPPDIESGRLGRCSWAAITALGIEVALRVAHVARPEANITGVTNLLAAVERRR